MTQGLLQKQTALLKAINWRFAHVKTAPHITTDVLLDPRFKEAYLSGQESIAAKAENVDFLSSAHSAGIAITGDLMSQA